jgi:hypothetical protein
LPGYPLHEAITALFLPGGPRLVNGATALASALAALGLFKFARALALSRGRAALLALAFAFTPVVFQNSTSSIDYVWSIGFVLWSGYALVSGRSLLAGVLLGAAIGARLTAGAMLLPWLILQLGLAPRSERYQRALTLCAATAAVALCLFSPVFYAYGPGFLTFHDHGGDGWHTVALRASDEVWGSLGVFAWYGTFAIALCALSATRAALRNPQARWISLAACSAIAAYAGAFLRLPHEAGYLIPCVPFALLLVALLLPAVAIAELALLLALASFISVDERGLSLDGPVLAAKAERRAQNERMDRVIRKLADMPGKALVVAGPLLPWIDVKLGKSEQGAHRYVYLLQSEAELLEYRKAGYDLYFVDRSIERRQRRLGIALRSHGARSLL